MALRSCLWSVWQPASGQSYKPWENKCFVHIRLQSIRFPLPPLAPFLLSFSDLRDIYRREPACPSLLGAQLVRPFSPAGKWVHLSAPSDETNRWMTGVNHTSVQDESSKTQWGGEGGRGSTELLSSRQWPSCQWSTSWCTVHLGASAEECNSPDILQKHLQTAVMLAVLQRFFSLFFPSLVMKDIWQPERLYKQGWYKAGETSRGPLIRWLHWLQHEIRGGTRSRIWCYGERQH